MATMVKKIYDRVRGLNASYSVISSSLGRFESEASQERRANMSLEVMQYLKENTLAFDIFSSNKQFSEKQLWVIAYELVKNEDYCYMIEHEYEMLKDAEERKAAEDAAEEKAIEDEKARKQAEFDEKAKTFAKEEDLAEGMRVSHNTFGEGIINSLVDGLATVMFDNGVEKKLIAKFAGLVIVK